MTPKLGDTARDKITGFQGIVMCHTKWLTGCDVFGIAPRVMDGGKPQEMQHFDVERVDVVERGTVVIGNAEQGAASMPPGGPSTLDKHPSK